MGVFTLVPLEEVAARGGGDYALGSDLACGFADLQ